MIKHIVMFRIPEAENNREILLNCKNKIENLKATIKEIEHIESGVNFSNRDAAYDMALISDFKSKEDLDIYRAHPDHQEFLNFLKSFEYDVAVCDYEY